MKVSRLFLAVILAAFTLVQIRTCIEKGGQPLRRLDAQSEKNSSDGAERFVQDGFAATSFLARYGAPLNLDSGSPVIRDSDIYTHMIFLPPGIQRIGSHPVHVRDTTTHAGRE